MTPLETTLWIMAGHAVVVLAMVGAGLLLGHWLKHNIESRDD